MEGSGIKVIKINHLKELTVIKRDSHEQIEFSKLFYLMDIHNDLIRKKQNLKEN